MEGPGAGGAGESGSWWRWKGEREWERSRWSEEGSAGEVTEVKLGKVWDVRSRGSGAAQIVGEPSGLSLSIHVRAQMYCFEKYRMEYWSSASRRKGFVLLLPSVS